ncbi:uncharacterized protein M421DRAFT_102711 [Didymella exigua CBS 183.55]|uniref:MutL C-terminal dimerisation domain-containing protein n=1 Tax=Didymella exigua CBS 183.55 TaxID=1150837 RepID=A0A6A5REI1_9PLEO|nr:uncharacterized protein M421DRAFT_102711 [Didymella exigua CBS 183.55]KAF1926092.1 hypothetical protein M421DRAFT_102711 [Didymella exigua CBS 183.55]
MSIRPLPDEVAAQIKSSTAIVSLTGVVLELVKNSLDAKAAKINVTVEFARGGCKVEDDGLGISPAEFSEYGGLGKLYWTSKYQSDEPHLGQHGTFLASLSAMSLLTVTSHHHAHRSHNSISFHHSHVLERQTPTSAHDYVNGKHGTRVTVRNLFGNMPVRVKQRTMVTDHKQEQVRIRDALRRDVAGLLLSWQGPVSLKIRDGDNNTIALFNTSNVAVTRISRGAAVDKPHSAHLSSLLHIMTQANYINIDEWPSWVSASATTAALSIKGAISLEPAPTKQVQFISFGIRPLSNENGCNELYDEVNRLFALSSFGTAEDDANVEEQEQLRRQSDKRFKKNGYTNRQLKARKGVDKYPMFHLRISTKDERASDMAEGRFIENESSLQAVVGILSAMITQWLSVHHFRPRKLPRLTDRPKTSIPPLNPEEQTHTPSRKRQTSLSAPARATTIAPKSISAATDAAKHKRPVMVYSENIPGKLHPQAFADWSRIKSGKSSFFETTQFVKKSSASSHSNLSDASTQLSDSLLQTGGNRHYYAAFDVPSIDKGALGQAATSKPSGPVNSLSSESDGKDNPVSWTDPVTKKTHLINARTGSVMPPQRPQTDSCGFSSASTRLNTRQLLRMGPRSAKTEPAKTPWIDRLLQNWDNPVFMPSEQDIQEISLRGDLEDGGDHHLHHIHAHCASFEVHTAFNDVGLDSARLSKDALRSAEVLSQVDKKFILVKLTGLPADSKTTSDADIMVLIDQHAADERIQVEALLSDLCRSSQNSMHVGYKSNLGLSSSIETDILEKPLQFAISPHEHTHFRTFAANFAAWAILYDISTATASKSRPGSSDKSDCKISIMALPPVISERCKTDPQILIAFLRSAVWKYVESPPLPPMALNDQSTTWVKKIATCPPGLIGMINSRACRSAIMFNDELRLTECKALVDKLAGCVFPFMCAHGRPSMVPIVDMGRVRGSASDKGNEYGSADTFISAWKRWRG